MLENHLLLHMRLCAELLSGLSWISITRAQDSELLTFCMSELGYSPNEHITIQFIRI
jgi:hypothetical protein